MTCVRTRSETPSEIDATSSTFCPTRAAGLVSEMRRFFLERGLRIERIREVIETQFPFAQNILVTSSPVQGLATATSDIDLIAIVRDGEASGGMATQIYVDGHHCELAIISQSDFDAACVEMGRLTESPLNDLLDRMDNWDRSLPVQKKYFERVINGVTFDGRVPFSSLFRPLSQLWACQALGRFVGAMTAMALSKAAGEERAPAVYAHAAAELAMDAALCAAGYVYSNGKWIGSRWRLFGESALQHASLVGQTLPDLGELKASLRAAIGEPLTPDQQEAVQRCALPLASCVAGLSTVDIVLRSRADVAWFGLGPGNTSAFARFGERATILAPAALLRCDRLEHAIDRTKARRLLAGLRAGVLVARLGT